MTMNDYPTYDLRPAGLGSDAYLSAVARLADDVLAKGEALTALVDDYAAFVDRTHREARRSHDEYLLEALLVGVLWRARGYEATRPSDRRDDLVHVLVAERRAGQARRRDGSTSALLVLDAPTRLGRPDPSLAEFVALCDWLVASGEYDDEMGRLAGWQEFLGQVPHAEEVLHRVVAFAIDFEAASRVSLGRFTERVDRFLRSDLAGRGPREDTLQCSRRRVEYHFNMVGAEILNRAWREEFLACRRHVVVLPGCARRRDRDCAAKHSDIELRCSHCTAGCSISAATEIASRHRAEALAVLHGSDFGRFLRSSALSGGVGEVGIVGVACVPGLVGAGWRARAQGLPAQCVLLQGSGCGHWRTHAEPTMLDLRELSRILTCAHRAAREPFAQLA